MRILDLGAHDGFLSTWIVKQLRGEGYEGDITLDGVELNSHGCEVFNRRVQELGVNGECKQGRAEDAVNLFEHQSYDAVLGCEIIEHVPNPEYFLDVCDQMTKKGGRVYISTPNGTFADGGNPHHLWAFRALDIFEMIRRRGHVVDVEVGVDTITTACYEPRHWVGGPEVSIYTGQGWEPWHPSDIEERGLGGSETAAVRLAEALTELGYIVTVYGEMRESGAWGQVCYRHHRVFDPTEAKYMVIGSRCPWLFDQPINASRKVLWMHDTDYGQSMRQSDVDNVDAVMVLSNWHRDHVLETYPWLNPEKVHVTRNGIHTGYFTMEIEGLRRNHKRAMYTSSPDRGLDLVLQMWPKVRERVPDAELYYCYSDVYNKVADQNPQLASFRKRVQELADQPGVYNLGSLPQQGLAMAMRESGIWLAPSFNTLHGVRFHETFCIGAVEAAAAGCQIITSDWGALSERNEGNCYAHIPGLPDEAGIDGDQWVNAIVELMEHPYSHLGRPSQLALSMGWVGVADDIVRAADSLN